MVRVGIRYRQRITKHGCGLLKRDPMFPAILPGFVRVPLKLHHLILRLRPPRGNDSPMFLFYPPRRECATLEGRSLPGSRSVRPAQHNMSEKLPSLVIVGRPNVGKSTLFNRLTGTRRSIVTNEPGITRDRIYGTAEWRGRSIEVVDTGGIVPDDKALIPQEILRQAHVAIDRAALLVLVVDSQAGIPPLDQELAGLLA